MEKITFVLHIKTKTMKKLVKILKWTGIILLILIVGFVIFVYARQGKTYTAPKTGLTASTDTNMIKRGEYLAYGPSHCSGCHMPFEKFPQIAKGEHLPLEGGFVFELPFGKVYTPNLTTDKETGIGRYTDEQLAQAMRHGVGPDGRAMLDFMNFHNLSDEDLTAIISFLRTQQPVKKVVPKNEFNFMGKAIYALFINPVGPKGEVPKKVLPDTTAKYGEYLARYVGNCVGCHTNRDLTTGAFIGEEFSGGFHMPSNIDKSKMTVSPNLTPDPTTGHIFNWDLQAFSGRLRAGRGTSVSDMPWEQFQQFSDNDLKAIYNYLKSLKPVKKDNGPMTIEAKKSS